jgi:adenylate cyclase
MKDHLGKRLKCWRFPLFCGVACLVTLFFSSDLAHRFKFFDAIEASTLDLRFALRGPEDRAQDACPIVIVKIDERSLYPQLNEADLEKNPEARYLAEGWAWNRAAYARLADRLLRAGARTIVFDLVFPGPNEGDFDLLDTIEAHPGEIVLGFDYAFNKSAMGEVFVSERPPYDDLLPVHEDGLLGFVNVERDEDGAVRRAKLTTNIFFEQLPFAKSAEKLKRLRKAAEAADIEYSLAARAALSVDPALKDQLAPPRQYPYINYGAADYFTTVSFIDVLLEDRFANQADHFKDAIVFVGAYSDFFKDVVSSPYGDIYGVDSHAHVTRSLLNDSFYHKISRGNRWLVLGSIALLLLAGTLYFRRATSKGLFIFSLLAFYLLASQFAFTHTNYILPVVPAVLIIVIPGILFLLYDFTITQYERTRLQGYLGRYVSPEVAELISDDSAELDTLLRGASRPIVALFSDIRGFTSFSERVSPEQLVAQLNEYFEEMVSVIHHRRGSLNKYIGDAILAVWGGIHSEGTQKDCENAVCAALEMGEALERLNAQWAKRPDRETLSIGIGLTFGKGFVGNMGHSQRMEFAVMGDVVNLASRLEGATKLYDGFVLVNSDLAAQCSDSIRFQEVDRLRVKGKVKAVPVHSPAGLQSENAPDWLAPWEAARKKFLNKDFQGARAAFAELAENYPNQAQNAQVFIERCRAYQANRPPEDWDGAFQMTSK